MRIDAQPLGIRLVGAMRRCRVGPRAYSPPHDYRYESGHAPVRPLDTAPVNPQTEGGVKRLGRGPTGFLRFRATFGDGIRTFS